MNAIIFGACGSIGSYILNNFQIENINSIGTTTDLNKVQTNLIYVDINNLKDHVIYQGLTKREYFAAMAMQALLSDPNITTT